MVKSKIEADALKELEANFENGVKLKQNKKAGRPKKIHSDCVEMLNVYNIPNKWLEVIKLHQVPFSVYAKLAIEAKLKADGWIK